MIDDHGDAANKYTATKVERQQNFVINYLVSVTAATVAETATYPLDITKTRLQVQGETAINKHHGKKHVAYRGMIKTAIGIVREEGLKRLWEGLPPAVVRQFIYSGCRMVFYEYLRSHVFKRENDGTFPLWKSAISAMAAGAGGQFLASPTDLVKVTMQTEGKRMLAGNKMRYKNAFDALRMLSRERGFLGMWKGWLPNVQRGALVNLGDFVTYDTSKQFFMRKLGFGDNIITHGFASVCSGFAASVLSTPADVVKTRIMSNPEFYKGSVDCFLQTVRNEGFVSLYKGFIPTWTRLAPWIIIFWLTNEQLRGYAGIESF